MLQQHRDRSGRLPAPKVDENYRHVQRLIAEQQSLNAQAESLGQESARRYIAQNPERENLPLLSPAAQAAMAPPSPRITARPTPPPAPPPDEPADDDYRKGW
jgi:hypothetical protein